MTSPAERREAELGHKPQPMSQRTDWDISDWSGLIRYRAFNRANYVLSSFRSSETKSAPAEVPSSSSRQPRKFRENTEWSFPGRG